MVENGMVIDAGLLVAKLKTIAKIEAIPMELYLSEVKTQSTKLDTKTWMGYCHKSNKRVRGKYPSEVVSHTVRDCIHQKHHWQMFKAMVLTTILSYSFGDGEREMHSPED
ncbi:hypothetical protein L195_g022698 [Trifolium pratense]|uniref:Uncharacterized protein n=1 Tax=Trifolium pratense TaxID=57577 RepID=A0A2K3N8Q5_TRIPR|nr:hypothetical protein L195_g022698 [Trifolium pratense]